jgi:hypothetical protein
MAFAQSNGEALQRSFIEGVQQLENGNLEQAESVFREMLKSTDSARVKLELARTLFLEGKYDDAKALFQEISMRTDTPWRVRDNIQHFVRAIEDKTGYLKFGVTVISDSNPLNLAAQKEFSIGGLQVTPTEAPKKMTGLRYSARGWLPLSQSGRAAGYFTASYNDYPGQDFDRLTLDVGAVKALTESGRVRGKVGVESGTLGGNLLYSFPYVGLDSVLAEKETWRLVGELKAGKVLFPDFDYLDATFASTAVSARKAASQGVVISMSGTVERSDANERPYSYYGLDVGPGIDTFWLDSAYLVGARASIGSRKYDATDPLFGERRSDSKMKLETTLGNKRWRWRNNYVSLVASLERNHSNIEFFSYRKTNVSVVVE